VTGFIRDGAGGDSFDTDDLFGRALIAKNTLAIIRNVDFPISIAVDGKWGSGKSTFLRKLGNLAESGAGDIKVVRVDAFSIDHYDNAFAALCGEILAGLPVGSDPRNGIENLQKAGRVATKFMLIAGAKVISAGLLSAADWTEVGEAAIRESGDAASALAGELIGNRKEEKRAFEAFREQLERVAKFISHDGDEGRILVIVDELDRCRPEFGLNLIEVAKHLFNVPGVCFIFSLNKRQFENTLKGRYGLEFDATKYLQKFFELEIPIELGSGQSASSAPKYISHLFKNRELFQDEVGNEFFTDYFSYLSVQNSLSLRDVERIRSQFSIFSRYASGLSSFECIFFLSLSFLRVVYPDSFRSIVAGQASHSDIFDKMLFGRYEFRLKSRWEPFKSAWRVACISERSEFRTLGEAHWEGIVALQELLRQYGIEVVRDDYRMAVASIAANNFRFSDEDD